MELFDGKTLNGWYAVPRTYDTMWPGGPAIRDLVPDLAADYEEQAAKHPAHWEVVDGAIEGFQDPAVPGYGGYLVTEQAFGDFELTLAFNMVVHPKVRAFLIQRELDFTPILENITIPVLVTHGRSDTVVLPTMGDHIREHCKTAAMSWYDGVGHAPFLEQPQRFNSELAGFARQAHG